DDGAGNIYKGNSSSKDTDLTYEGTDPQDYIDEGYTKHTNSAASDWTDLIHLTDVLDIPLPETIYPEAYVEEINKVLDVDQWLMWLAAHAMLANNETNLGIGDGDDYFMYRGISDPNFVLLPHDLDSVFRGSVDVDDGIFKAKDLAILKRFLNHPQFAPRYYGALKELIDTALSPQKVNPLVDELLNFTSNSARNTIKQFILDRNAYVLNLFPQALTVSSSLPKSGGYHRTTSSTTSLSGDLDAIKARSVLVNGIEANLNPVAGSWITGSTVSLNPGINRVIVQMFDAVGGAGQKLDEKFIDVWRDKSTQSVSGTISSNTTWTASNGPYRVTSNLTISAGVTLTIEPGTTVFFSSGRKITVMGRLLAEGTEFERIRMTRYPTSNNFVGIQFSNTTEDNRITYAVVEYGVTNNGLIGVVDSKLLLDHVTLDHTDRRRIRTIDSSLVVRNCVFTNIFELGTPPSTDNLSEHIWGSGVPLGGELIIENNSFGTISGHNDAIDLDGPSRPNPIPQILNNVFHGGGDDALDLETDAHIEGNIFMNYIKDVYNTDPGESNVMSLGGGKDYTVVRNIFHHNDHVAQVKDGAFMIFENNTVNDSLKSAVFFDNFDVTPGEGAWVDGSIFTKTTLIFDEVVPTTDLDIHHSIVSADLVSLGNGNLTSVPRLADPNSGDFSLLPGSPALGTGPNKLDMGAQVPAGASISGEPPAFTNQTNATLTVNGPGVTHYKYKLNAGSYGLETPVNTPIELTSLADGLYTVYVIGKNSAGVWQELAEATESKTWTIDSALSRLVINEVLAINNMAVNHAGNFPDMIELYYTGTSSINLSGYSISDKLGNPKRFVFPSGTELTDGQYLVLNNDPNVLSPGLHIPFSLDGDGEGVYLFDMSTTLIDSVEFGKQVANLSIGRIGQAGLWTLNQPTLGSANIYHRTGNPAPIKINEWLANGDLLFNDDFIELYNPDNLPVPLAGMSISDNSVPELSQHQFEPLSFIAAAGFADFKADGKNTIGHISFKLSADMEILTLMDQSGTTIDKILYSSQKTDVSQGRFPDGSNVMSFFDLPTPGLTNALP
ncbi:MAG: lamin tail domain-containing protein, partial [Planctomycetes bacterium]|nr:lamin tail domain-containing protein [Planctomycetota bacterium]